MDALNINFPTQPFELFVDVGLSHNAPYTREVLKDNPNTFVIGVEPHLGNCKSVRSLQLPRFHLIEAGAYDGEGEDSLELNMMQPDPGTSSFLEPTDVLLTQGPGYSIVNKVKVKLITLESVLSTVPWDLVVGGIFNLKTDTQGFDYKVLKGLGDYINRVQDLQIESTTHGQYEQACTQEELFSFLNEYMNIVKIDQYGDTWLTKKK